MPLRDVIGYVIIGLAMRVLYRWSIVTMHPSCMVMDIWSLKGHAALFSGHMTSSVTWPLDSLTQTTQT